MQEVAPGVHVAHSSRDRTASTLIGPPAGLAPGAPAILVDPAWTVPELDRLAARVDDLGVRVVAGFATHAHHDHVLWHPSLPDVPRWSSPATAGLAERDRDRLLADLQDEGPWPPALLDLVGRLTPLREPVAGPGASAPPGTVTLPKPWTDADEPVEVLVHDAHCPGHSALWLPRRRVLLAGDMLSDVELPLPFEPDDLAAYRAGLDLLAPYAARAAVVVPGHGRPALGAEGGRRADADRRYLDALLGGRPGHPDLDDPRRAHPGMPEVHDRLVALSRPPRAAGRPTPSG